MLVKRSKLPDKSTSVQVYPQVNHTIIEENTEKDAGRSWNLGDDDAGRLISVIAYSVSRLFYLRGF